MEHSDALQHVGRPTRQSQESELDYWVKRGLREWDMHLTYYLRVFPFSSVRYDSDAILDIGSGPISVFERVAPPSADLTPYDSLAPAYNRLATNKSFIVTDTLPDRQFDLITAFNCLDHMLHPAELLRELSTRMTPESGRLWVYCHIDRPFSPVEHPLKLRFWHLVDLISERFILVDCGLTREGRWYPYAWWGIAKARADQEEHAKMLRSLWWKARCAATYSRFHGRRGWQKALRISGLHDEKS